MSGNGDGWHRTPNRDAVERLAFELWQASKDQILAGNYPEIFNAVAWVLAPIILRHVNPADARAGFESVLDQALTQAREGLLNPPPNLRMS